MKTSKLLTAFALGLGLTLALLWLLTSALPVVRADTIGVTTTNDAVPGDGECSLREAIIAANTDNITDACPAGSGADVITLTTGTYVLTRTGTGEDACLSLIHISEPTRPY